MDIVLKFAAYETEDKRFIPAIILELGLSTPTITFETDISLPDRMSCNQFFKMFVEAVKASDMIDYGDGIHQNGNERGLPPAPAPLDPAKKKREGMN